MRVRLQRQLTVHEHVCFECTRRAGSPEGGLRLEAAARRAAAQRGRAAALRRARRRRRRGKWTEALTGAARIAE